MVQTVHLLELKPIHFSLKNQGLIATFSMSKYASKRHKIDRGIFMSSCRDSERFNFLSYPFLFNELVQIKLQNLSNMMKGMYGLINKATIT